MSARFRLRPNESSPVEISPAEFAPRQFHRRLPGYAPTPLIDAPEIAEMLGVRQVLLKNESSRFGLPAFKILGASWAVYRARARMRTRVRAGGGMSQIERGGKEIRF